MADSEFAVSPLMPHARQELHRTFSGSHELADDVLAEMLRLKSLTPFKIWRKQYTH